MVGKADRSDGGRITAVNLLYHSAGRMTIIAEVLMKSIIERAEIGRAIDQACGWTYTLRMDDLKELRHQSQSQSLPEVTVFEAGFYAGISCAINRGFSKTNDPRKAAAASLKAKEGLK